MKKDSFFSRIHRSKKKQILFFAVSMVMLLTIYFVCILRLSQRFEIRGDNFSWVYQIESIKEENAQLVIEGWAFELEEMSVMEAFEIILYDVKTKKGYYPKMFYEIREDVNSYFLCEYDYKESGFKASIPISKLDLENQLYEVLLRPKGEKKAYSSGIYYADGEMVFVNPNEFVALETSGTDLDEIVNQGVLRVYRPDYGMYVYQYKGELYWIAEEWYEFVDNNAPIEVQINTTQIQNLPEERLSNNWFWDNLGFLFQSKELVSWKTGKYRVAKVALPKEYSITHIWTGKYINDWIWRSDFRPWYEFQNR